MTKKAWIINAIRENDHEHMFGIVKQLIMLLIAAWELLMTPEDERGLQML